MGRNNNEHISSTEQTDYADKEKKVILLR